MASFCPKCNGKLKITDWRPNCPHCGVNLVYYGIEDRLLDDADKAEAEHAHFQKRIDRLKAVYIGSKLAIARIVVSLLPILALLLPLGKFTFNAPFIGTKEVTVNLISIINSVSKLNFDALIELISSDTFGVAFILFAAAVVLAALSAVFSLLHLIFISISASPKGHGRNLAFCIVALLLGIGAVVSYVLFCGKSAAVLPGFIVSGKLSWGAFLFIAMFLVPIIINVLIKTKGAVVVKYTECFVGGIPSDEYDEMVKSGMSTSEIRKVMAQKAAEKEAAEAAENTEKEAAVK